MGRFAGDGEQGAAPAPRRALEPIVLAGLVLYVLLFVPGWIGLAATVALTAGAVACLVIPLRRQRTDRAYGWWAFAASFVLFGLAGVSSKATQISGVPDSPETMPLSIAAGITFLAAHLEVARINRGGRAVADIIDIIVIGSALSIIGWRALWAPHFPEESVGSYFFLTTLMVATAIAARIMVTGDRERRAGLYQGSRRTGTLVMTSFPPVLVAGTAALCGMTDPGDGLVTAAWPISAVLLILAINEPEVIRATRPPQEVEAPVDQWRLYLIGAATPVPLVVGLVTDLNGSPGAYVFGMGILMSGLVTARTGLAFRRIRSELDARTAAEAVLAQQERYDTLTGLPNRALFRARIEAAITEATDDHVLAVLYLDVDRFKVINDTFGQRAGDEVLIVVADRLRRTVRDQDMTARLSSDEFAVILERLDSVDDAYEIAERIRLAVREPIAVADTTVHVGASIGLSVFDDEADATDLQREADVALSTAKRRGGNAVVGFDASLRTDVVRALSFEHQLVAAAGNGELRLHYQPQIDLVTGRICGLEALIRWQHPEHGLLSPAAFVDIAEETGLIVPIGAWVIEEACRQHRRWQAVLGPDGVPPISINVSPTQLTRDDVAGRLERALAATRLDPDQIHIEITEVVLMGDSDESIRALEAIDELGVGIAVDDFGTGYFSLSHLRRFPVHLVKVDQSFVRGVGTSAEDEAIIDATIRLAHALGMSVIAEGVETEEQLAYLRLRRCDAVQGYLFSKPIPPEDVATFVADHGVSAHPVPRRTDEMAPITGSMARAMAPRLDPS